ncbi:12287_t:CDS:2, partial [Entrophospora sp. SA101]
MKRIFFFRESQANSMHQVLIKALRSIYENLLEEYNLANFNGIPLWNKPFKMDEICINNSYGLFDGRCDNNNGNDSEDDTKDDTE